MTVIDTTKLIYEAMEAPGAFDENATQTDKLQAALFAFGSHIEALEARIEKLEQSRNAGGGHA